MAPPYDLTDDSVFVVIGSGAGGGTLSNELAQKGIDVVCLEAGARLTLADVENDPPLMDRRMGWNDKRYGAPVWLCKTVGGTTMRWTAVCPRFLDHEFKALSTYGPIEGTSLIDWPLTLEELAPYYDRAEDKMGVSGTHGIPPSAKTSNFKVLEAGGRRVGYNEISSTRAAINPVARDGRPGCQQIGFCSQGCAIGAKWSTLYTEIPKAEASGHFELRPNCMAVRINHDAAGRVTGVVYRDTEGNLQEQKARAVAVACNVVETTRLLMLSESSQFPDGLANSSGHLGRNYMRHMNGYGFAVMPGPVHFNRGARITGFISDERYHRPERGFAGGYLIQPLGVETTFVALLAGWGESAARWMEQYPNMAGTFIVGEDPPQQSNRITLHPTDTDEAGLPVPVIDYVEHANTVAMKHHAFDQAEKLFASLGGSEFRSTRDALAIGCHSMGVARMSAEPGDGVTNRWGQAHDIPNLFVSDGSLFPTSGAPNPTLTIVALAIRQAEHIAGRMARGEL